MNTPIDVADVLARAEGHARLVTHLTADPRARQLLKDLVAARDAFAELIAASQRLTDSLTDGTDSRQYHLAVRAAVARAKGGAA